MYQAAVAQKTAFILPITEIAGATRLRARG